eukprot:6181602-Pleurochrysis_carterae.AAC.4
MERSPGADQRVERLRGKSGRASTPTSRVLPPWDREAPKPRRARQAAPNAQARRFTLKVDSQA